MSTPGVNRDSTINGLPQSAINISIDGINSQDNYLKTSDGFFSRISPRLDSVEEVTVSTATRSREWRAGCGPDKVCDTAQETMNSTGAFTSITAIPHSIRITGLTIVTFRSFTPIPVSNAVLPQPGFDQTKCKAQRIVSF